MRLHRSLGLCALLALSMTLFGQNPCKECPNQTPRDADQAWGLLAAGNARFQKGNLKPREDACRRTCTSSKEGQKPFAVVLACADSRVSPEIAFDQRIGDLFVVRVAGNVASDEAIGSIEYALDHLKTPKIVVVLGHEKCGAVEAALELNAAEDLVPSILNRIFPAIKDLAPKDLDKAVRANVDFTVRLLSTYSPAIHKSDVRIQGAYYSVATGLTTKQPAAAGR